MGYGDWWREDDFQVGVGHGDPVLVCAVQSEDSPLVIEIPGYRCNGDINKTGTALRKIGCQLKGFFIDEEYSIRVV